MQSTKTKTSEYITIILTDGKKQKRTIYTDEKGKKYVYQQGGFWDLENYLKKRKAE